MRKGGGPKGYLKNSRKNSRLTAKGADAIQRLAEGETVRAVAENWGCSVTVVYWELEKVRAGLGAKTTEHAVAIWVEAGKERYGSNGKEAKRAIG